MVKKFGEKAAFQGLANDDLHHQSKINSIKTTEAIPNYSFARCTS